MFAMYSTDGENSNIILIAYLKILCFFVMFFIVSFISIRFWHETSYLAYILIFLLLLGVKYFGLTSSGSRDG